MWSSTNDDDMANRLSVLSTIDAASVAESATPAECKDAIIQLLQNQILEYESKCNALQRSVPRFAKLYDSSGKDVTDQMTELTRQLTDRDFQLENVNALCARKHEELEQSRSEFLRRLRAAEEQADEATRRAKAYEAENNALREQIENEQSRLYRVGHMGDYSATAGTDTDVISHAAEQDILDKLQQELNDRLTEVEAYRNEVNVWRQKYETQNAEFDEMKALNAKYRTFVDRVLSGNELKKSFLEKSLTAEDDGELDYAVANLLATLKLLDANGRQMAEVRMEVMDALRRHGYVANEEVVKVLSQSLRRDISQRHQSNVDEQMLDVTMENQLAQVSMNAKNVTFNMSTLNKTAAEVSQDIGAARRQMGALRTVCTQLFEKLRGTAEFLEQLLEVLGETEEGREILKRIQELRLDLDKSLHEANFAASEFEKAEKSMIEYCEMMSQLVDTSMFNVSAAADDDDNFMINMPELDRMRADQERLQAEVQQLEVERTSVTSELERLQSEAVEVAKELEEMLAARDQTAEEVKHVQIELQQLEIERTRATSELERLQTEAAEVVKKFEEMLADRDQTAEEVKHIQIELQRLEVERTGATSELERLQFEATEMAKKLEEMLATRDQTAEEVKHIQIELQQLEVKQTGATSKLERLQSEAAKVAKKLEEMLADRDQTAEEVKHVQIELQQIEVERTSATSELERLQFEAAKVAKKLEEMLATRDQTAEEVEHLQSERSEATQRLQNTKGLGKQITCELSRIYDSLANAKETASNSGILKSRNKN